MDPVGTTGQAGGLAAFWLTRPLGSMLVDVAPDDPLTFGAATLAIVGVVASLVPALRPTRVDPLTTLRSRRRLTRRPLTRSPARLRLRLRSRRRGAAAAP